MGRVPQEVCAGAQLVARGLARELGEHAEVRGRRGLVVTGPGAHAQEQAHRLGLCEPARGARLVVRDGGEEDGAGDAGVGEAFRKDLLRLEAALERVEGCGCGEAVFEAPEDARGDRRLGHGELPAQRERLD